MNRLWLASAMLFVCGISAVTWVIAERGEHDDDDEGYVQRYTGVARVLNTDYAKECGACHMAYPPGLLPAASWNKIMAGLDDHFGENAELNAEKTKTIGAYLRDYSADTSSYRRSRQFAYGLNADAAPLRITQTPYFLDKHDEIPKRLVQGNKQVGSFSQCNACHRRAQQASFREQDIRIPGYGRWDD